jgi:serine/threonine-protein kinase HipA
MIPSVIRDASPDAWGRRVIIHTILGHKELEIDTTELNEITYLLSSGSDRIGNLDFQISSQEYIPRHSKNVSLEELLHSAEKVEKGLPLSKELDLALFHGSSIGGARPKALIEDNNKKYIAKFSFSSDLYSIVKAEFIAMRLAKLAGINVPNVEIVQSLNKDVLLIERFDREWNGTFWSRKSIISALTLLGLDEMMARYASYEALCEIIRHKFSNPKDNLTELFKRLVFNILCGNTDDHARNHAVFWDGVSLSLTPAYDICPQNWSGNEASQGMIISGENRKSQLASCLQAIEHFQLSKRNAKEIIQNIITVIQKNWKPVCESAKLSKVDQNVLWGRQFLNAYSLEE